MATLLDDIKAIEALDEGTATHEFSHKERYRIIKNVNKITILLLDPGLLHKSATAMVKMTKERLGITDENYIHTGAFYSEEGFKMVFYEKSKKYLKIGKEVSWGT